MSLYNKSIFPNISISNITLEKNSIKVRAFLTADVNYILKLTKIFINENIYYTDSFNL